MNGGVGLVFVVVSLQPFKTSRMENKDNNVKITAFMFRPSFFIYFIGKIRANKAFLTS